MVFVSLPSRITDKHLQRKPPLHYKLENLKSEVLNKMEDEKVISLWWFPNKMKSCQWVTSTESQRLQTALRTTEEYKRMVEGIKTTTAQPHFTIKDTQQMQKEGNKREDIPVMNEMLCGKTTVQPSLCFPLNNVSLTTRKSHLDKRK